MKFESEQFQTLLLHRKLKGNGPMSPKYWRKVISNQEFYVQPSHWSSVRGNKDIWRQARSQNNLPAVNHFLRKIFPLPKQGRKPNRKSMDSGNRKSDSEETGEANPQGAREGRTQNGFGGSHWGREHVRRPWERPLHETTSMAHRPQLSNSGGNLDNCEKIVDLGKSTSEAKTS